jgi:nucleotide-binding universal stress UspA family protein
MNIKKILFVADSNIMITDDFAYHICSKLKDLRDVQLTILLVVDEEQVPGYRVFGEAKSKEIRAEFTEKMRRYIDFQLAGNSTINADIKVRCGIPFIEIIKESVEGAFDIIIKSQDTKFQSMHSLDLHLLRKTQVPVWIVNSGDYKAQDMLVAAIDLDLQNSEEGREINSKIMDFSLFIADALGLRMRVVSCWNVNGEDSLNNNPYIQMESISITEVGALEENRYMELMKSFISDYKDVEYSMIKGDVVKSIANYVSFNRPKALIMGTFSRTGLRGYLIGNTAEDVLLSIDSSVVAVKPDGFSSPVI